MRPRRFRAPVCALLLVVLLVGPVNAVAQEATPAADLEANRALAARIYEAVSGGDLDALDAVVAPDVVDHYPLAPGQAPGRAGLKATFAGLRAAFPDIVCRAEALVAEGDKVAVLEWCTGTQRGEFLGIPPTNRPVAVRSIDLWRVEGGQLTEYWNHVDVLGLLTQLGVVPGTSGAATPVAEVPPSVFATPLAPAEIADADANKEVVRQFIAAFAAPDPAVLDRLLDPDFVNHDAPPGLPPTREGLVQLALAFEAGIPDYRVAVEEQIAEGDLVATRATASGTQTGAFLGFPATGRAFAVPAIFVDRVVGGRVVEHWEVYDRVGLLMQIGLLPVPAGAPATPAATPTA